MLEHGLVVEQGAHDELLARSGRYAELYGELGRRRGRRVAAAHPRAPASAGGASNVSPGLAPSSGLECGYTSVSRKKYPFAWPP